MKIARILSLRLVPLRASLKLRPAFNESVAYCYVTIMPNAQKNDIRCEYTRGAPELLLLQILIDI